MIPEIQTSLEQYWNWLRDKTALRTIEDCVEITTPYLDRHNDCLQIYVKRANGEYTLTDDGYILEDLKLSGFNLDSPKRKTMFETVLNGFGVHSNDDALEVTTSEENFGINKHNLLQAMLAVNDLFYLASPVVVSLFHEDVTCWLDSSQIRYTPNLKFTGRSGYDHRFDFVVPKSETKPERIIRAINQATRDSAQIITFAWLDTKETRSLDSEIYAILNDTEKPVSKTVIHAMNNYEINPILWSVRDESLEKLAA